MTSRHDNFVGSLSVVYLTHTSRIQTCSVIVQTPHNYGTVYITSRLFIGITMGQNGDIINEQTSDYFLMTIESVSNKCSIIIVTFNVQYCCYVLLYFTLCSVDCFSILYTHSACACGGEWVLYQ